MEPSVPFPSHYNSRQAIEISLKKGAQFAAVLVAVYFHYHRYGIGLFCFKIYTAHFAS